MRCDECTDVHGDCIECDFYISFLEDQAVEEYERKGERARQKAEEKEWGGM